MKAIQENKNKLLHRDEVIIEMHSEATPSKEQALKTVSEHFKISPENIVISKVGSRFGSKSVKIRAKIYENHEAKKKYEIISRKERKKSLKESSAEKTEAK